uniref:Uncharacterized protein n=1 Tax=Pristionchus pacificus TaxID=54126 RepID=A0A2A6BEN7_PRIPA|eukprot:PDM64342.1 hypothetical protein PRIPAC_52598 [Pristionchus pacificus]
MALVYRLNVADGFPCPLPFPPFPPSPFPSPPWKPVLEDAVDSKERKELGWWIMIGIVGLPGKEKGYKDSH